MNLFKKEKGIVLSILNAVLIIWILSAIVIVATNITSLLIKDYTYTYNEYKTTNCNFEYETEQDCKNNYSIYKIDLKYYDVNYKRNIIMGLFNICLVTGVLFVLNKEKSKKQK